MSLLDKLFPYPFGTRKTVKTKNNTKTQEQSKTELIQKRERVNSKMNQFKSIFGFGEKLTLEEEKKLVHIDSENRRKVISSRMEPDKNSIWE